MPVSLIRRPHAMVCAPYCFASSPCAIFFIATREKDSTKLQIYENFLKPASCNIPSHSMPFLLQEVEKAAKVRHFYQFHTIKVPNYIHKTVSLSYGVINVMENIGHSSNPKIMNGILKAKYDQSWE